MCTGTHPYIPVINTAKVELFMRSDGQQIANVFHVLSSVAFNPVSLAEVVSAFEEWCVGNYFPAIGAQVTLNSIKATDLSSESGSVYEKTPDEALAGGVTGGEAFPNNSTVVLKWLTSQRGRSYRGRTYVPGMRSSIASINTLLPTPYAAIVAAASQLWSQVRAAGWDLAVVSYCNGKEWRTTGVATPIVSWALDETLDSQRRRLPGRGK